VRDGAGGTSGRFILTPSGDPSSGVAGASPDTLFGRPVYSSGNITAGSDIKTAVFGDLSYFVLREVGGLQIQRSADFAFDKNLVSLRGLSRVDSVLSSTDAINTLHQNVT
jgi:HK97 family phage major capsid protein